MASFLLWENTGNFNHLHGRYDGETVDEAVDNLARGQKYVEDGTIKNFGSKEEWFKKRGTSMSRFISERLP